MKLIGSLLLSMSLLLVLACGSSTKQPVDQTGPEYTSAYICPMHCEGSGSDHAGTCPVCKMDYVVNEDFKGEVDHSGHNH